MPRALPAILALLVSVIVAAPPAAAQTAVGGEIAQAAEALRSDPVYVAPDADPGLSDAQAAALRERIRNSGAGPMYIAVLSPDAVDEAGGDPEAALRALIGDVRRNGSYVLVSGRTLRTASNTVRISRFTDEAIAAGGGDVNRILTGLVDRTAEARQGGGSAGSGGGGGGGGGGGAFLGLLALLGAGFAAITFASRRRRRKAEAAELEEIKANVRDDLIALGDDIRALDIDMELDTTPQPAKEAYAAAVGAYERAETTWERARSPEDLEPVGSALEEGRYAMVSAKALVEGREPPARRPPCFFDPRHGPSDRDVEWSPPFGEPRLVPACEADAQRVERGDEPAARELVVGGSRMPYWNAGPAYAPFAGGYYGGFGGGLFPGLLMGSMLGASLGMGMGMGLGAGMAYGDGGGFDGGGFDFGGGGGGGFDFGGGDFGGGDFGGGGGDF